jgi:biotin synthase
MELRHDWTVDEVMRLARLPLFELVYRAQTVHREAWGSHSVQLCSLLSIKTGGCPEDCGYCPQSAHHPTQMKSERLLPVAEVLAAAAKARDAGAGRFCMGAAWSRVREGREFEDVLEMVRGVKALGMEACCTLGMLSVSQAQRLKEAGLDTYNHNLDTSEARYGEIISTRTYQDRLETLRHVRSAGISVCCGGIIGMGESLEDRCQLLITLAALEPHPDSVPVNALVPVAGTPLADRPPVDSLEMVRTIALARILMPRSAVRLSAGRDRMTEEAQLLCMLAGANSIFFGDRLLTTPNPDARDDLSMLAKAGVTATKFLAPLASTPSDAARPDGHR